MVFWLYVLIMKKLRFYLTFKLNGDGSTDSDQQDIFSHVRLFSARRTVYKTSPLSIYKPDSNNRPFHLNKSASIFEVFDPILQMNIPSTIPSFLVGMEDVIKTARTEKIMNLLMPLKSAFPL
jgi:hypothetical protein